MMAQKPESAAMRADAEALEWIVALQEDPADADVRKRFEQWRAASPLNAASWEETAHVYSAIGGTQPDHRDRWETLADRHKPMLAPPIAAASANGSRSGASGRRRYVARRTFKVAAASAAAVTLAVVVVPELALRWRADAVAGTGEVRRMGLADGSHASLSPRSAFRIDFSEKERRITLLRGQAWFNVRHESGRPFRVIAGDVATTDIGTSFEVGSHDEAVHVAVSQGAVRVDDTKNATPIAERLVAGQSLSIDRTGRIRRASTSPYLVGAWRDGQLAVQDRPMSEVIEALRPWHRGVIVIRSETMASRRVTGVYDLRNPAGAMVALTKAYGGSVTQITPWVLILSDG